MRIRTVKPEFWRSDDITNLSREDRLLFIGLWSYVDDNGVGIDDYRSIAADLFALEDDQKEVRDYIREGLATLSRALLVSRYMVGGKRYLYVNAWDKHQRVDRPNKSRYPRPESGDLPPTSGNMDSPEGVDEDSRDFRETPSTGTEEQRNRGTEEKEPSSAKPPRDDVLQLCEHLADLIEANTEDRPAIGKRWHDAARILIDKDLAHEADALGIAMRVADWATGNEFWRTNILSMPKFRAKFKTLRMQARDEWKRNRAASSPATTTITGRAVASIDTAFEEWERRNGGNVHQLPFRAEGA